MSGSHLTLSPAMNSFSPGLWICPPTQYTMLDYTLPWQANTLANSYRATPCMVRLSLVPSLSKRTRRRRRGSLVSAVCDWESLGTRLGQVEPRSISATYIMQCKSLHL